MDTPAVQIGRYNDLRILREVGIGFYLDGGELGDILLPNSMAPKGRPTSDTVRVFIYLDSEDRLIATTLTPLAQAGEAAVLTVKAVTSTGAFLDWGLPKDLLAPFKEQKPRMEEGKSYLVCVYFDEASERLAASNRLDRFLNKTPAPFRQGQPVDLLIGHQTELGYTALVGPHHWGMLFFSDIFQDLQPGQRCRGYVKQVRPDGKLDLSLQQAGENKVPDLGERILADLRANGGFLHLTDKTPPVIIYKRYGVSKKVFKKALGALYAARKVTLEPAGVRLAE